VEVEMQVLVAYASRHGATRGIAERVAATLERNGIRTTLQPAGDVRSVKDYDAVVVGGAAYAFHWLKEATGLVRRHRDTLAVRPVWLFSSGPLGTDAVDKDGRDVRETTRPSEFAELEAAIHPRDTRVFFGAWDPTAKPVGLMERMMRLMPAARNALPTGDFRDWADIEGWADEIARELGNGRAIQAEPG
jgi:menaquinone-dependent protoporphyrinogen oxidase